MNLIFIHGPAASGKLTTGRALHRLTGYRLFHNHLVVDTLLAVFPFGSEPFVRLREAMWLSVFEAAARGGNPSLRIVLSDRGGHVGFHGAGAKLPWHDGLIAEFFAAA